MILQPYRHFLKKKRLTVVPALAIGDIREEPENMAVLPKEVRAQAVCITVEAMRRSSITAVVRTGSMV